MIVSFCGSGETVAEASLTERVSPALREGKIDFIVAWFDTSHGLAAKFICSIGESAIQTTQTGLEPRTASRELSSPTFEIAHFAPVALARHLSTYSSGII